MKNKIFKSVFSVILALFLFLLAYKYLLNKELKSILLKVSFINILSSTLFVFVSFLVSGLQLNYMFNKQKVKLSNYDTLSIPYVINLWGYIIPLQGSFLYLITYLRSKYQIKLTDTSFLYAFIFLVSLSFFGIVGLIILYVTSNLTIEIFIILLLSATSPLFILLAVKFKKIFLLKNRFLIRVLDTFDYISTNMVGLLKNYKIVLMIVFFNLLITFINTLWSYWIIIVYNFDVPFSVVFVVSIIMNISMLFKFTPGNLGLNQIANGGVFILFGYDPSIGVFISIFQFLSLLVFSFPLGLIFSINNIKDFSVSDFRKVLSGK